MPPDSAFRAIADPRRREILRLVRDRELTAGEIASHFEISQPGVSQHLRVLRESNLLVERRDGTRRLYRANLEGLAELVEHLGWMWDQGLDRLKQAVEEDR
ncbi:MAG: metalloregulator ArsR/SmtB family transcription factor [Actinomycetota bacterium]